MENSFSIQSASEDQYHIMQMRKQCLKLLDSKENALLPFSAELSGTGSCDGFTGEEAFTGAGMVRGRDGGASETSDSED